SKPPEYGDFSRFAPFASPRTTPCARVNSDTIWDVSEKSQRRRTTASSVMVGTRAARTGALAECIAAGEGSGRELREPQHDRSDNPRVRALEQQTLADLVLVVASRVDLLGHHPVPLGVGDEDTDDVRLGAFHLENHAVELEPRGTLGLGGFE